jgi:alcohol dehydrogenase class IV
MDLSKLMAVAKMSKKLSIRNINNAEIIERLPLILVPTTCGTGSEVTDMAVVKINGKKITIRNEKLIADTAILDSSFLKSLPKEVLAYSVIDALAHAIEGMMTVFSNEITDMLAKKAVELIFMNLNKVGENRGKLLIASTLAGIVAREAKTTIGHWMAYTIAEEHNFPHGLSCAIPLPYVMMFNLKECEKKFEILAGSLGVPGGAIGFIKEIKDLMASLGIPTTLNEIGVKRWELSSLAKKLVDEHQQIRNIKDITYENIEQLYINAWGGSL